MDQDVAPRPAGATGAQARAAGDAADRALPADRRVGEPCATCPPPGGPATEWDGALIGEGCTSMSRPRAQGRLDPLQGGAAGAPSAGDGAGLGSAAGPDPAQAGGARERVTPAEVDAAYANAVTPTSACCQAQQRGAGRSGADWGDRTIVYVNGITTAPEDHCATLQAIANTTCARVLGVYNATDGFLSDLGQSLRDRSLINAADGGQAFSVGDRRNPAVDTLADLITGRSRAGQPVEVWAHSQGGAVASLALFDANRRLRRLGVDQPLSLIDVHSFASAAPQWIDGPTYEHFVHTGDFTPSVGGIGIGPFQEIDIGRGADVTVFANAPAGGAQRFVFNEVEFPPLGSPGLQAVVPNEWNRFAANHSMNDVYLSMYRQQRAERGQPVCPGTPQ